MPPCQGVGSGLSPAPRASWPRFRPSAPLGGQPPSGCLFQVGSREGPPEAPSSTRPPSSPAQKQSHAPPQPTAHKSLSPRDLACPFHVPAAGGPPLPLPQTAACQTAPQAWLRSGLLAPPPRGARGHFKGERTALPPSPGPEWGLSQAINAGQPHHCANSPSRTGWAHPQTPPGQAGGFLLALRGCVKQKAWNGG